MSAGTVMVCITVLGLMEFNSVIVPIVAWVVYGGVICFWSLSITRKGVNTESSTRSDAKTVKQILKYSIPLGIAGIVTVATGAADPMVVGGILNEAQLGA